MGKNINQAYIGTKDRLHKLLETYPNIQSIENAEVYWDAKLGILCVLTSQEWKDYLLDRHKINSEPQNR